MTEQPKPQPIRIPDAPLNAREHDMVDDMAEQIAITEALRWETIMPVWSERLRKRERGRHRRISRRMRSASSTPSVSPMPNQYEHAPYTCVLCGKEETGRYSNDAAMREARHCFKCNFWIELASYPHPNTVITSDFEYYQAEQWGIRATEYKETLGFGGSHWKVVWLDGTEATTNNLWYRGSIPDRFRDRFAVNVKSLAEGTNRAQHEAEYDPR